MTEAPRLTRHDIDKLTAYLPRLYADGFSPVLRWHGGERGADGSYSLPYPEYHPLVEEFFGAVGRAWLDPSYDPASAARMLKDEGAVRRASLAEVRSMLTFCARGERFSDGHRAAMIEEGYIRRLLERLITIRRSMG